MRFTRSRVRGLKKRILVLLAAAVVAVALVAGGYWLVRSKIVQVNPWFVSAQATIGVDVSEHQGAVDMGVLADQGVSFVYIKATEGSSHVDACFADNWAHAHAVGLPAGAYHFFSFDSPGADQAQSFIDTVGEIEGLAAAGSGDAPAASGSTLVPVVDVEWYADKKANPPARADVVRELGAYLQALEAHYGAKPMIYTTRDVYDAFIAGAFDDYAIWASSTFLPASIYWGDRWLVWQYSDLGLLEGYDGREEHIDLNVLASGASVDDLRI